MKTPLRLKYYSGQSAQVHEVLVEFFLDSLSLTLGDRVVEYRYTELKLSPPLPNGPTLIYLPDGAYLECPSALLPDSLVQKTHSPLLKLIYWMESHILGFGIGFVALILILVIFVKWGIPYSSSWLAQLMPVTWLQELDDSFLKQLDESLLKPSELTEAEQKKWESYFKGYTNGSVKIQFRSGIKWNAFALAGDTLIMTDTLLKGLKPQQALGVFFHEMGHLKRRHVVGNLIAASSLSVISFLVVGEMVGFTESLSSMTFFMTQLHYSRALEEEADQYAIDEMVKISLSPRCYSEALQALAQHYKLQKKIRVLIRVLFDPSRYFSSHQKN